MTAMELFDTTPDPSLNLLPADGIVNYYGKILEDGQAGHYFRELLSFVAWQHDEAIIFGKRILTRREVAWYGSGPYAYTYSRVTRHALPWTPVLLELKERVESLTGETFNSCLLNLYHNGEEGMAWHSDEETDLKKHGAIASLSLGAARKFYLKHRQTQEKIAILLEHGSLLVMKGTTQTHWLHRLPQARRITEPRINLTFRTIVTNI